MARPYNLDEQPLESIVDDLDSRTLALEQQDLEGRVVSLETAVAELETLKSQIAQLLNPT